MAKEAKKVVKIAKTKHTITLAPHIDQTMREIAAAKGISFSAVISLALEKYFREEDART